MISNIRNLTFAAIRQFRIDTPFGVKQSIIPAIALFVNGLSLVVVAGHDATSSTPTRCRNSCSNCCGTQGCAKKRV